MKIKSTLLFLFISMAVVGTVSAKKEKKEKIKGPSEEVVMAVKTKVSSRNYVVAINSMASQGGDMVAVEYGRFLEVGVTHFRLQAPILSMGGPMEDYKIEENKKGVMIATFGARTNIHFFTYVIEIRPDGQTQVKITSNFDEQGRRTELWLYGTIYTPELDDK